MCGFAGVFDPSGLDRGAEAAARSMGDRLAHRGPDDAGTWLDHEAGIAFAHRRLAIVDLSPAGAQPMHSHSGRYVVAFNGEIYDHLDIRHELAGSGVAWRGRSDTETLLAAIERWGVRAALERSVGMFAFALWDRRDRVLTLARDRIGEKPCYYGWTDGVLLFGSELKALKAHPAWRADIDPAAVASYLRHGYVPAPHSIYRGFAKLTPGTLLSIPATARPSSPLEPEPYWTLRAVAEAGIARPFAGSDDEAVDELERLLARAVSLQRVSDVPLGAFLSGGIDSSTVVALMQAAATERVRTFTIGFDEAGYDESGHAEGVARHLGTDHTAMTVTPDEALTSLHRMAGVFDEPFGDASAIPTMLLAAMTRRHVTVSLSGDGGDELFAGYGRYHRVQRVWGRVERFPLALRRAAAGALGVVPAHVVGRVLARVRPGPFAHLWPERIHGLRAALTARDVMAPYREVVSVWQRPRELMVASVDEAPSVLTDGAQQLGTGAAIDRMAYADGVTYLPDDVLVKVDRAAMAVSLETRVPLLDHRVVAFAWSLPLALKVRNGSSKWPLRKVLDRYVPSALIDRPKMGFGVPMDRWLRGPLREWGEELLSPDRLAREGLLRPEPLRAAWDAHQRGPGDWQHHLWPVLAFQAWLDHER